MSVICDMSHESRFFSWKTELEMTECVIGMFGWDMKWKFWMIWWDVKRWVVSHIWFITWGLHIGLFKTDFYFKKNHDFIYIYSIKIVCIK